MDCNDPERLLQTVPFDYTVEMAYINHDVLKTSDARSINTGRLSLFLKNVENNISDCVFITTFGIDGPAVTSILKYDGKGITYTVDGRRFNSNEEIQSYKIISMYTDITSNKIYYSVNYHVITTNNLNFTIYQDIVFLQVRRLF